MKKTLFLLTLALLSACSAWALEASFLSVEGRVQYKANAASDWKDAAAGVTLAQGAEILTASNSSCQVSLGPNESALRIQADSRAVLTSLKPVQVKLESGKLYALVRNLEKGSSFEVRTPTAIAAARGTGWGQDAHEVAVFENQVDVQGAGGGDQSVDEGKGIHIGDDGTLGELFDLPESEKEAWNEFKENVTGGGQEGEADKGGEAEPASEVQTPTDLSDATADAKEESIDARDEQVLNELRENSKEKPVGNY